MQKDSSSPTYARRRRRRSFLRLGFLVRTALVRRYLQDGSVVLDVGAADGAMLDLLSKHVRLSLSVSLERDLSLAKLIPTNGVCGSALALPFGSNIFDIVICSATRKHIKDSLALIEEIARVLKPGGRVIVIDPHPLLLRLGRWLGKFDSRYLHHMSSAAEISTEFRHAGLVACSAQTHAFVCCVGKKPSNSI